jgi:hypothetical protein
MCHRTKKYPKSEQFRQQDFTEVDLLFSEQWIKIDLNCFV